MWNNIPTPAYVFDFALFRKRAEQVREAFGSGTKLCFSIKANPFLLAFLPDAIDRIEVCSPGELTICEKLSVDMDRVIFSGVNKTEADVERAVADGVGTFTAESRLHVRYINRAALERGTVVPLLLRLTGGSQFGMDEAEVLDIIAHRADYPGVRIVGLHYFTGTQKRKPALVEKELALVESFLRRCREELGFPLERVEYGTGLAVDYFSEDPEQAELERLAAVAPAIRTLSGKVELTVEMGRFFAAPCGFFATKVVDTKCNMGVNYAILDGGLHQLKYDGQLQGMQIPPITHVEANPGQAPEKWTLCGSLCTTADVLARNAEFSGLKVGDTLVFGRVGAYSVMEGMAVFLSRDMPAVYLTDGMGELKLARKSILTDAFNTPFLL